MCRGSNERLARGQQSHACCRAIIVTSIEPLLSVCVCVCAIGMLCVCVCVCLACSVLVTRGLEHLYNYLCACVIHENRLACVCVCVRVCVRALGALCRRRHLKLHND